MNKYLILISFVLCLFNADFVFAVPSEGAVFPDAGRSLWSVQANYIGLRDFNKVMGKASSQQHFISAAYAITEKFFINGKVGLGGVEFKRNDARKLVFTDSFVGGYGLRYLIYNNSVSDISLMASFQHISCHPYAKNEGGVTYRIIWDEWQGALLLIKKWQKFFSYIGPVYSCAQLKYKVDDLYRRLKAEDSLGMVLGSDFILNKNVNLNIETRFFCEWGINTAVIYKF